MCSIFIEIRSKPSPSDGDTCADLLSNVRPDRPHIPSFYQRFQRASFRRSIRRRRVVGSPPPVKGVLGRFPKSRNSFFAFSVDFLCFFVTVNVFNGLDGIFLAEYAVFPLGPGMDPPESGVFPPGVIHPQARIMLHCAKHMWEQTQYAGETAGRTQDICVRRDFLVRFT